MRSPFFCDSCIQRDFAKLADQEVWTYGTVEELIASIDNNNKCRLCQLIWGALGYGLDDADSKWQPNWQIKLCPPVSRPGILRPSYILSEQIVVLVLEPGPKCDAIDKKLSKGPHPWSTLLLEVKNDVSLTASLDVRYGNNGSQTSPCPLPRAHARDDECFESIQKWLHECTKSHKNVCNAKREAVLPTRVLQVFPISDQNSIRLVETTAVGQPTIGVYTALSYSWGGSQFLVTNKDNIADHKKGIRISDCPLTIQDAIEVTRKLHIPYLWVDALCIIQGTDDIARKDFIRESAKMGSVYSQAFMTIVAANTNAATQGFLTSRKEQLDTWVLLDRSKYYSQEQSDFYRPGVKTVCEEISPRRFKDWRTTVDSRAWCLQEKVLSQRILSYHDEGLSLVCHYSWSVETGQHPWSSVRSLPWISFGTSWKRRFWAGFRLLFSDDELSRGIVSKKKYQNALWTSVISHYSGRNISRKSDRLVAIAGIAQVWQEIFEPYYLAGIWSSDIHRQLLWRHKGQESSGERCFALSDPRRCPSWSWAYSDGEVDFHPGMCGLSAGNDFQELNGILYSRLEWVSGNIRPNGSNTWNGTYILVEAPMYYFSGAEEVKLAPLEADSGIFFDSGTFQPGQAFWYIELVNHKVKEWGEDKWFRLSSGLILVEVEAQPPIEILGYDKESRGSNPQQGNDNITRDRGRHKIKSKGPNQVYASSGILELDFVQQRDSNLPQFVRVGTYRSLDVSLDGEERISRKILIR